MKHNPYFLILGGLFWLNCEAQIETIVYTHDDNGAIIQTVIDTTIISSPVDAAGNRSFVQVMGSPKNPLPVELSSFTARGFTGSDYTRSVLLDWITKTEQNNKEFQVFWSQDGVAWDKIGTVDGANTKISASSYQFWHTTPEPVLKNNYYRLKQVDHNGVFEYSRVAVVNFGDDGSVSFELFPNPTSGQITVQSLGTDEVEIVSITDINGRLMLVKVIDVSGQKITISVRGFSSGTYVLTMKTKDGRPVQLPFVVE